MHRPASLVAGKYKIGQFPLFLVPSHYINTTNMLQLYSLLAIGLYGASSLAMTTAKPSLTTASAGAVQTSVVTITSGSGSTSGTKGNYTLTNFSTTKEFGLTVLQFDFIDASTSEKGSCDLTMTHRYDNDLCGQPSNFTVSSTRGGHGEWPLTIALGENTQFRQVNGQVVLKGPGKQGITCTTADGKTICKSKSALTIPYVDYSTNFSNGDKK